MKREAAVRISKFFLSQGPLLILLGIIISASFVYPNFLTARNIWNVLTQNAPIGILALGFTFVILMGGIDLSVGSTLALCGAIYATLSHTNMFLAIVIPLLVGAFVGAMNGFIIAKTKIVPFVVTLASMFAIRGIVYIYSNMFTIPAARTPAAAFLGRGDLFSVPMPVVVFISLTLICIFISKRTTFGRYNFAVGGNEEAARYMGLPIDRIKIWVFTMSGLFASICGIVLTSRLQAAQALAGVGWELQALAIVLVGGTLLTGGVGSFTGTFIGTLIMGLMFNLINQQGTLSSFWQLFIRGAFLLIVVILQRIVVIYRTRDSVEI